MNEDKELLDLAQRYADDITFFRGIGKVEVHDHRKIRFVRGNSLRDALRKFKKGEWVEK